jgi:hypothetical protein
LTVKTLEEDTQMALTISRPAPDEYAEFHRGYLAAIAEETDALTVLRRQQPVIAAFGRLTPAQAGHRYADGKWSVREIVGHLSDAERVVAYRLLCVARGERAPLPGFDEQAYAGRSNADRRALEDLVKELSLVRETTLTLVRSLDDAWLLQRGTVNNWTLSVRALAYIIPGHFQHHVNVLGDRYGIQVGR